MAATSNKRPLPSKVATMKDRKRRKLESGAPKGTSKSRMVPPEWKKVPMLDHQDNYEGFLELEELDGMDVVRDDATGRVSIVQRKGWINEPVAPHEGAEDDEWSGFGDDDADADDDQRNTAAMPNAREPKIKPERKQKPPGTTKKDQTKKDPAPNGSFRGLEDEDQAAGEVDIAAWRPLNLSSDTLSSLSKLKFASPTAIQKAAVPEILAGHDVIGKASTGSGKTLAFGIPILESFLEQKMDNKVGSTDDKSPLALILSPTRELAYQLDKHLKALCSSGTIDGPLIATLTGGLSIQKQQRLLKHADIVIGTPGRLWEVISEGEGTIKALKAIQFLVVDEADRLLSEGHFKEVEEILNALDRTETNDEDSSSGPKQPSAVDAVEKTARQTLVFSATFDRSLQRKLANKSYTSNNLLSNKESMEYLITKLNFRSPPPKFIDVNPIRQLATNLREGLVECSGMEKDLYLYTLLLYHTNMRTLVFTNSISAVRRLAPMLQNLSLPVLPLHSGMPQKARLRSVERFTAPASKENSASILVATDVAARGLDIPHVDLVIHYHLPRAADTYVHRSGRTARAGESGSSILICAPEEVSGVRRLVAKVHASAGAAGDESARQGKYIRTLDTNRLVASRLKRRATLAKQIADAELSKTKGKKEDSFLRAAAEELGVDYESEDDGKGKRGRGAGRKKKERESRALTKAEVGAMKAELRALLAKRVNVGVSEKYLTSGGVDVEELLAHKGSGGREFLGSVQDLWS